MGSNREEIRVLKELRHFGTPLDERIVKNAIAASQGLEITQTGSGLDNMAYVLLSGGVGITLSLCIENVSNRTIKMTAIRLKMPWSDPNFSWVKKQSSKALNRWGGYLVKGFGTYGLDPTTVLNHRITRNFTFYPGDAIEGFLLGEGDAHVPANYLDRTVLPMQIVVWGRATESYGGWLRVGVSREKQTTPAKLARRKKREPLFTALEMAEARK